MNQNTGIKAASTEIIVVFHFLQYSFFAYRFIGRKNSELKSDIKFPKEAENIFIFIPFCILSKKLFRRIIPFLKQT